MAQLEIFEPTCETSGCGSRATRQIVSGGVVLTRHCTKHSGPALVAANRRGQELHRETAPLPSEQVRQ